jgi:hypothetical protein
MNEMQEIVTVEQAARVIRLAAIALPLFGLLLGGIVGAARRQVARGLTVGILCGMVGPAVWGLWFMYNGVVGTFGLDSVKGLLINLALFVGIGLAVGLGIGLAWRRFGHGAREGSPHPSD